MPNSLLSTGHTLIINANIILALNESLKHGWVARHKQILIGINARV